MAVDYYQASERELDTFSGFIDELAESPADFTKRNVASLARTYFGRRAAGKTVALDVDGMGVVEVAMPAAKPEPAPAAPPAAPSPGLPPGRQPREVSEAVQAHRREFAATYGAGRGSTTTEFGNLDGFVIRATGELVRGEQHTSAAEQERLRSMLTGDGLTRQQRTAQFQREADQHAEQTAQRKLAERARIDAALRGAAVEGGELLRGAVEANGDPQAMTWGRLRNAAGRPRPVTR